MVAYSDSNVLKEVAAVSARPSKIPTDFCMVTNLPELSM
jgi:hypothetical protein